MVSQFILMGMLVETGTEKGETLSEFCASDLACTGFRGRRNYI